MTCRVTCGRMAGNRTRACMTYAWRGGDGGVAARRRIGGRPRDFSGGAPESRSALALRKSRTRIENAKSRTPIENANRAHANRERKPRPRIETGRVTAWLGSGVCSGRKLPRSVTTLALTRNAEARARCEGRGEAFASARRNPRWHRRGAGHRGRCRSAVVVRKRWSLQVVAHAKAGRQGCPGGRGKAALVAKSHGRSQGWAPGFLLGPRQGGACRDGQGRAPGSSRLRPNGGAAAAARR